MSSTCVLYVEHATDKCDPFEFLMLQLNGRRSNVLTHLRGHQTAAL
jgi:hypothetical protein